MNVNNTLENRILNINKPRDWTSFDVVKKIRKITRIKKVGHAGTLDPFATGVLLIAMGKGTRQISHLMDLEKEYIGTIELGTETDTCDATGTIIRQKSTELITPMAIRQVLSEFVGEIEQIPPTFSAVKVNGVRAYKLARQGIDFQLNARRGKIFALELLECNIPLIQIRVCCSKGTYIRALARDIGAKLETGANLKELVRSRIGNFRIEDAIEIEDFEKMVLTGN